MMAQSTRLQMIQEAQIELSLNYTSILIELQFKFTRLQPVQLCFVSCGTMKSLPCPNKDLPAWLKAIVDDADYSTRQSTTYTTIVTNTLRAWANGEQPVELHTK